MKYLIYTSHAPNGKAMIGEHLVTFAPVSDVGSRGYTHVSDPVDAEIAEPIASHPHYSVQPIPGTETPKSSTPKTSPEAEAEIKRLTKELAETKSKLELSEKDFAQLEKDHATTKDLLAQALAPQPKEGEPKAESDGAPTTPRATAGRRGSGQG